MALVHHGQQNWAAGYGVADRTTGQPVTAVTRFQAASLSKPVTAWGVLRLVESGRIGLDEPIIGRLRRWRPPPSPFGADGVTVRRLLSHTAGLSVHGYIGQTPTGPWHRSRPRCRGDRRRLPGSNCWRRPAEAGCTLGGGYSLLQLLVEELTGRPFADYMPAQVLEPLGMTASSSVVADRAHRPPARHRRPSPARLRLRRTGRRRLVTTAPDLACFLGAALAGPRGEPPVQGVLSPAGVRLALTADPQPQLSAASAPPRCAARHSVAVPSSTPRSGKARQRGTAGSALNLHPPIGDRLSATGL